MLLDNEVASIVATANNISLAEASDLLIASTNTLGRSFDESRDAADLLTKAAAQGATTSLKPSDTLL